MLIPRKRTIGNGLLFWSLKYLLHRDICDTASPLTFTPPALPASFMLVFKPCMHTEATRRSLRQKNQKRQPRRNKLSPGEHTYGPWQMGSTPGTAPFLPLPGGAGRRLPGLVLLGARCGKRHHLCRCAAPPPQAAASRHLPRLDLEASRTLAPPESGSARGEFASPLPQRSPVRPNRQ